MKYRILIVKGFHLHSPYNIQFKPYWYSIWKIIGGRYESIDHAKAAIIRDIAARKSIADLVESSPKPGIVMVYTPEEQVVDKLKGIV